MLNRPPPGRSPRARWQADYRRRRRDGAVLTEVPAAMIELLITGRWLDPTEAGDKHAIAQALDGMARSSLKSFR
jgi:hypothetical protein